MPVLISAGNEWIQIRDAVGVAFRGLTGPRGTKHRLRPLVGPITFTDVEARGHRLVGIPLVVEVPYTGDGKSRTIMNVVLL